MNRDALYSATSKVAWGYFFLRFNLNIGALGLLPDWVCYLLIFGAITLLAEELRDLPLLKPFCILLGVWEGACWSLALFGFPLSGAFYLLDLLLAAVSVYFHFQLLTDMGALADRYQAEDQNIGQKLRRGRNVLAVLTVLPNLLLPWNQLPQLTVLLALVGMGTALYVMYQLFALHRVFRDMADPSSPQT